MTLTISNLETKSIQIPLIKESEADLARIKLTYFNTSTKKYEKFEIYDYLEHFKTYGCEWTNDILKFKYEIKLVLGKIQKKRKKKPLDKTTRKKIYIDESRVWKMSMRWPKNKPFIGRISYLMGYLYNENHVKSSLGITGSSFDFTKLTNSRKKMLF